MKLLVHSVILLTCIVLSSGCSKTEEPATPTKDPSPIDPQPVDKTDEKPSASLEVQTPEETEKLIASHKGKIVVVDLWALW
jgi:hypothetical protein